MNKSIYTFFIISIAISWTIWILMLLSNKGMIGVDIPRVMHFSTVIGPLIGAVVAAGMSPNTDIGSLFRRLFRFKVGFKWYFYAIMIPFLAYGIAAAMTYLIQPSEEYRFNIFLNTIAILLTMPFIVVGEEVGWRGFALPVLSEKYSALKSSLIIGVMWGVWHLPAFFVANIFESTFTLIGVFLGFVILCMILSVLFTWVVNSARGSVFIAVMMHSAVAAASSLTNIATKAPLLFFTLFTIAFLLMAVHVTRKWGNDLNSSTATSE